MTPQSGSLLWPKWCEHVFHRLIEKDCQMCWIVFFTVKTYQNQIIIFSLRFLLAQSCTYGAGWCFVCTIRLLSTCCFQVASLGKLKIFCAFRAAFGKQSNPETLKFLLVCFALTCKLILMERSVSHNETDIQKISNEKKTINNEKNKKIRSNGPSMKLLQMKEIKIKMLKRTKH